MVGFHKCSVKLCWALSCNSQNNCPHMARPILYINFKVELSSNEEVNTLFSKIGL